MNLSIARYSIIACLLSLGLLLSACGGAAAPSTSDTSAGIVQKQELPQASAAPTRESPQLEREQAAPQSRTDPQAQDQTIAALAEGSVQNAAPAAAPHPSTALSGADQAGGAPGGTTGGEKEPNEEPYGDTFFKDYGVNPFLDTSEDALSTFGVDVDTGSYTIMRRYLTDGHLPPADAVRVEEYINFFDQGYEPPTQGAFRIVMDGAPSPFGENEQYALLRVGLKGREISSAERKNANLVFVVDVSGSMDMENRLGTVKEALRLLVEQLRPTDRVAIVVYGSQGRILLQPTSGENKEQILNAINQLVSEGSTNAEEGLRLAYEIANTIFDPASINALILCSDGVANVGATGPDTILSAVKANAEKGISLNTIGFGMGNYNDVLMEQLANDGDGGYYYVDTLKEAERVFVENLSGTLQVIAYDAKVQVEFNPAVVDRYRLIGYENRDVADQDFRNDQIDAGEIGAGHSVTALYEVRLVEGAQGPLATTRLRYRDAESNQVVEIEQALERTTLATAFGEASPHLQLDAIVVEYAEILRESYWAKESSLGAVEQLAAQSFSALKQNSDVSEFLGLLQRANQLKQ